MARFFTFFQTYGGGILFFFLSLAAIAFLVQWFAWIFGIGRFRRVPRNGKDETGKEDLRFIFSRAIVKIIDDFRHLLALVMVLIFAFALAYSLIRAGTLQSGMSAAAVVDNMKDALQAVAATLGGLVGSIMGYYFGESSALKARIATPPQQPDTKPMTEPNRPVGGGQP